MTKRPAPAGLFFCALSSRDAVRPYRDASRPRAIAIPRARGAAWIRSESRGRSIAANPAGTVRALSATQATTGGNAMVHTLAHRPRMQAGLHLHEPPSAARIAALSGMFALHVVALMLLLMPMAAPVPTPAHEVIEVEPIVIRKQPELVPVVPPPIERPQRATETRRPQTRVEVPPVDIPVVVASGEAAPPDVPAPTADATLDVPAASTGPIPAVRLEYASAPAPAYPREAARRRLEGTVMLQVLVDVDGRPVEVLVQQSSGHRQLDEAARRQVLERWRFRPAMRDGVAVQAIGLVPVEFKLR